MSYPTPAPGNDYVFVPETPLSDQVFTLIFASLAARLKVLEAVVVDWRAAIDDLTTLGLGALAASLTPALTTAHAEIDTLSAQVALAEDRVAALIASQLPATSVTVTATGGISATTVQAALAELDTEKATTTDLGALATATTAALAAKADTSTTYTRAQVDAAIAAAATSYATLMKMGAV